MNGLLDAMIGHLVGDFVFQNDWMAKNKKLRNWPCLIHCAVWTCCVAVTSGWVNPFVLLWLFWTHFYIDRTSIVRDFMRMNGQEGFASTPFAPWSVIVVDQVFHVLTLRFAAIVFDPYRLPWQ